MDPDHSFGFEVAGPDAYGVTGFTGLYFKFVTTNGTTTPKSTSVEDYTPSPELLTHHKPQDDMPLQAVQFTLVILAWMFLLWRCICWCPTRLTECSNNDVHPTTQTQTLPHFTHVNPCGIVNIHEPPASPPAYQPPPPYSSVVRFSKSPELSVPKICEAKV